MEKIQDETLKLAAGDYIKDLLFNLRYSLEGPPGSLHTCLYHFAGEHDINLCEKVSIPEWLNIIYDHLKDKNII